MRDHRRRLRHRVVVRLVLLFFGLDFAGFVFFPVVFVGGFPSIAGLVYAERFANFGQHVLRFGPVILVEIEIVFDGRLRSGIVFGRCARRFALRFAETVIGRVVGRAIGRLALRALGARDRRRYRLLKLKRCESVLQFLIQIGRVIAGRPAPGALRARRCRRFVEFSFAARRILAPARRFQPAHHIVERFLEMLDPVFGALRDLGNRSLEPGARRFLIASFGV